MDCILFWATAHKEKEFGRNVRPASWEAPDTALTPAYLDATPERLAWLEAHGNPVFVYGYDATRNILQLQRRLGYWPTPIDVPVEPVPPEFDDPIPFDKGDINKGLRFNGPDYIPEYDHVRLTGQILRIFDLMADGRWRTLAEIQEETGDPQASISAQLRHLRKPRFGEHIVDKRRRGEKGAGLFEYRLIAKLGAAP